MFFRYLKTLFARLETRIYSRNHDYTELARRNNFADDRKTKRIMVFGDSNAFRPGHGKNSWPKLLENNNPFHLDVYNESLDGRTTRYDIGELNGLGVIGKKLDVHAPLEAVLVMLGTNDVKNKYGPPSPAEIAEGMSRILKIIENHSGGTPILLTPPPLGNVISGELEGAQSRISSVIAAYRMMAADRDIQMIDIYSVMDINTDLEPDMVHLNALGRKKIADTVSANLIL